MARRRKSSIPGMSYSWRRASGITSAKQKIARATGIPTTRTGRRAKAGRAVGCAVYMYVALILVIVILAAIGNVAFAATTEEITFRGIPWFISPVDFISALDESIYGCQQDSDDHFIHDSYISSYDPIDGYGYINTTKGCSVLYAGMDGALSVAGYPVDVIAADALFGVDETGALIEDPSFGMVVNARYHFSDSFDKDKFPSSESGCKPLELRLTDKYGKSNGGYRDDTGHYIIWLGKNGTYVELNHQDDGTVFIEYGTMAILGEIENAERGELVERKFADDGL